MYRGPPRAPLTDPPFPYTTRVRSTRSPEADALRQVPAVPSARPRGPHVARRPHREGAAVVLGRPARRQPGPHRPDGPGPQAPHVRHARADGLQGEIGRAHVLTPVTNAQLVCRLLLENNKTILSSK